MKQKPRQKSEGNYTQLCLEYNEWLGNLDKLFEIKIPPSLQPW